MFRYNLLPPSTGLPFFQWRTEGELGVSTPPPEIPKALQNRAKLNPTVKIAKNCRISDANTRRCLEKWQKNSETI